MPKTGAERAREYRARLKGLAPPLPKKGKHLTPAERQRISRQRKKERANFDKVLLYYQSNQPQPTPVTYNNYTPEVKLDENPIDKTPEAPAVDYVSIDDKNSFYEASGTIDNYGVPVANEPPRVKTTQTDESIMTDGIRDQYSVYGEYIAHRLRSCFRDNYEVFIAQHNIDNILFNLSMGGYSRVIPKTIASASNGDQQVVYGPEDRHSFEQNLSSIVPKIEL